MEFDVSHMCRVCGYMHDWETWEEGRYATFVHCLCCGCEFGNHDYPGASLLLFRRKWVLAGFPEGGRHRVNSANPAKWRDLPAEEAWRQMGRVPPPFRRGLNGRDTPGERWAWSDALETEYTIPDLDPRPQWLPEHGPLDTRHVCRVCGYAYRDFLPWGADGATPAWEICDCCGVEFGHEDATLEGIRDYRTHWTDVGCFTFLMTDWIDEQPWPTGRPETQLAHIPRQYQ